MTEAFYKKLKSTKFQLFAILLTSAYIMMLFYIQYTRKSYPEEIPQLETVSEETKKIASNITVGMYVNSFPAFSFNKNNFTVDAIIWFRFPKATEDISTLEKFTLKDSTLQNDGNLVHKSLPIIKVIGDEVLVCYHVLATFMSHLKYKHFPISDHRLSIILQNKSVTSKEMVFDTKSEYLTLSDQIFVEDWTPKTTYASGGYIKSVLNPKDPTMTIDYPAVVFSVEFVSVGARNLISLYFPLFVVFFIGLLSLFLDVFNFTRIGIIASSLPILVLFRMVIESVSPSVGYTTHIDFVFYTLVFLSVLMLLFQTYILLEAQEIKLLTDEKLQKRRKHVLEKVNTGSFFAILLLLVLFMTYNFFR